MIEIGKKIVRAEIQAVRPDALTGQTYKIKTPMLEYSLFVTINDVDGKPYEIFINSKNMAQYQWIVALTLLISSEFRAGTYGHIVSDLKSVFDPNGGYFKNGKYIPSVIYEIGDIIEKHLEKLGVTHPVSNKKKCPKCGTDMVEQEGCASCPACGESKCS